MSFSDVKDQAVPLRFMGNMLRRNRIPNALLFWGPEGVGKRMTALELVKALFCTEREGDNCGTCLPCRKVAAGNHPDLFTIAPVKKSRIIDVQAVEDMNEMASLRPFEAEWRAFLILEAERMGIPAQNHLLKTLEEPPGNSLFILLTEYPGFLLPTIRSRCQRIRFGALRPNTVQELLTRDRDVAPEKAQAIASLSQGQMARAFDLVDSERRDVVLDAARRLDSGEEPLGVAEEFSQYLTEQKGQLEAAVKAEQGVDVKEMTPEDREQLKAEQVAVVEALYRRDIMEYLYLFETWYRDKLVFQATGDASRVLNTDQAEGLSSVQDEMLDKKISAIERARTYLERFLNQDRVLRDLFFALADQG